jgi:hypothetical protein
MTAARNRERGGEPDNAATDHRGIDLFHLLHP